MTREDSISGHPSGRPERSPSGESGYFVPPNPVRLAEIVGRHMRWIDLTEDWKGAKSKSLYQTQERVKKLEELRIQDGERRQEDRIWLERELAEIKQNIAIAKGQVRATLAFGTVALTILNIALTFVSRFIH